MLIEILEKFSMFEFILARGYENENETTLCDGYWN